MEFPQCPKHTYTFTICCCLILNGGLFCYNMSYLYLMLYQSKHIIYNVYVFALCPRKNKKPSEYFCRYLL